MDEGLKHEKTCGSVIFTRMDGEKRYFLIKNADSGHIGFPKGHVEGDETEEETAVREVFEETGIKISVDPSTRQCYTYKTTKNSIKECVYFCSEYDGDSEVRLQNEEISESWLVGYDEAMKLLNYPQDIEILKKADKFYD